MNTHFYRLEGKALTAMQQFRETVITSNTAYRDYALSIGAKGFQAFDDGKPAYYTFEEGVTPAGFRALGQGRYGLPIGSFKKGSIEEQRFSEHEKLPVIPDIKEVLADLGLITFNGQAAWRSDDIETIFIYGVVAPGTNEAAEGFVRVEEQDLIDHMNKTGEDRSLAGPGL